MLEYSQVMTRSRNTILSYSNIISENHQEDKKISIPAGT